MIFKRFSLSFLFLFAAFFTFCNVIDSAAQPRKRNQKFVVNKIKLDGNIIIDNRSLSKSTELGSGVQMNDLMRELLIAEMEGYYSSKGFYLVQANFPKIKPQNDTLTLFIDEGEEIKRGDSERERAEQAVTRLVSYRDLQIPELNRQDAINKLMQGYKTKRILEAELERKRREKQKANLMMELKKQAAKEEAINKIKQKEWSLIMENMKNFLEDPNSKLQPIPWKKDFQRAQASVNRLIRNNQIEVSPEMKRLAILKLTKTYRSKRQERLMALKKLRSKTQGQEDGDTGLISSELSKLKRSLLDSKSKLKFVPWEQDYKKAQAAVDQLINKKQLNVSPAKKQQVIAKLIKAYREKRLGQLLDSKDLEYESAISAIKPDINKAMNLDNSEVSKMRQRMETIMANQTFLDKPEKKKQKMKKRLIEIQSKQNFDL
jgi:antitoxin component HigA of HigAB toxin-antitoxin module